MPLITPNYQAVSLAARAFPGVISTNSGDDYSVNVPGISRRRENLLVCFQISNTNSGPATLDVNGFGALPIIKDGSPLIGGELPTGKIAWAICDQDNSHFVLVAVADSVGTDGETITGYSGYFGGYGTPGGGSGGTIGGGASGYSGYSGYSGSTSIQGASDVAIDGGTLSNGQVLAWNAGSNKWVNADGGTGGSGGGLPGSSGYSGYSGKSGYSGYSGAGTSGYSGYSGTGVSGYSGYSGSGASGYSGYSGVGLSGYSGYSGVGVSGYSGYSGLGLSGSSGYSGYSGAGFSGYSGYSGASSAGSAKGGPIFPHSSYPATSNSTFPNIHVGGGANSKEEEGLGVAASLAADATWRLRFQLPPSFPSGSAKIVLRALANAASGAAKVTVQLAKVAAGSSPSGATLTSEAQQTVTWSAGENDVYKETKLTLANTALTTGDEGKVLVCDVVYNASGWTLAQVSTWQIFLIWE